MPLCQFLAQIRIRPGDKPASGIEERLNGKGSLVQFHHALLVHQGLGILLTRSHGRPVGLPAKQILWIETGRLFSCNALEEVVYGAGEVVRFDLDALYGESAAFDTPMEIEADV